MVSICSALSPRLCAKRLSDEIASFRCTFCSRRISSVLDVMPSTFDTILLRLRVLSSSRRFMPSSVVVRLPTTSVIFSLKNSSSEPAMSIISTPTSEESVPPSSTYSGDEPMTISTALPPMTPLLKILAFESTGIR